MLLAWGFHGVWLLRWPFYALNAVLFASAIFIGGHYVVDLVVGAAIAGVAIVLAGRVIRRRRSRRDQAPIAQGGFFGTT